MVDRIPFLKGVPIWDPPLSYLLSMVQSDVKCMESVVRPFIINITMEIYFSSKVYSKSLLKGSLCRVPHFRKSYLVQKYGGRYFAKVQRIDILSRIMEADIFQK